MPSKVTDPALLDQLNSDQPKKVADPALLSQLNGEAPKKDSYDPSTAAGMGKIAPLPGPIGMLVSQSPRTVLDQAMQVPTFGYGDEITNMMGALIAHQVTGEPLHDLMDEASKQSKARLAHEEDKHPYVSAASQALGAAIPVAGEGKLLAKLGPETIAGSKRAANIAKGAAGGAAGGAAYGSGTADDGNRVKGAIKGAEWGLGGGAGASAALEGASKLATKNFDKAVKTLQDAGVKLTPGQMSYKSAQLVKRAEDALGHIPLMGSMVKDRLIDSFHSFNEAILNKALAPIGEKLPKTAPGRESIAATKRIFDKKYDEVLPKTTFAADQQFIQDTRDFLDKKMAKLAPEQQKEFSRIIKNATDDHIIPGKDRINGEAYKKLESDISHYQRMYRKGNSPSPQNLELADTLGDYLDLIRNTLERQNPKYAPQLQKINSGYSIFKKAEAASTRRAASNGLFSPDDILMQLKKSYSQGEFARGESEIQKIADAGSQVLPKSVPKIESGSGGWLDLISAPAALATPILYNKGMFNAMNNPATRGAVSKNLSKAASVAGATTGTLLGKSPLQPSFSDTVQQLQGATNDQGQ